MIKYLADMVHLMSFVFLLARILKSKSTLGISSKTQELYLIVFILRYMDLFMYFVSFYNTLMKIAFIGITSFTIHLLLRKKPYCSSYNRTKDSFKHFEIILPVGAVLTLFIHSKFTVWEMCWSYSLWIESMAIFPQLDMLRKMREAESLTSNYVAALGIYRLLYVFHWYCDE